ncbi:MAG: Uma2 family endonuclease [Alkalispirochaeta sp.]
MSLAQKDEWYSYYDYLSWPEGERVELIDGTPYAMSPAPRREHQRIVSALNGQMYHALRDTPCEVYPAPFDVKLSPDEDDHRPTVVQPDLTIICDPDKLTEQGITGAPDLVIEIVSPDSGFHDRGRKFDLYRDSGVREYWIVDPDERVIEVYQQETDGSYRRVGVYGRADTLTAGINNRIVINLTEVFPPEPTRPGPSSGATAPR